MSFSFLNSQQRLKKNNIKTCLLSYFSLVLIFCTLLGCSSTGANGEQTGSPRVELTPKLKELLGPDDGYAFAIMYGADLGGNLNDCGCHAHPMGGLGWRMGYEEGFRALHKDIPALQVDAGHLFSDVADGNSKLFPDAMESNKWMLKGYSEAKFAAINISYHELPYLAEVFKKDVHSARVKEMPVLEHLISANVRALNKDFISPNPYVIRDVKTPRSKKVLRVGFTGITTGTPPANSPFTIDDPSESLKRIIPELRAKADIVVVMAYALPAEVEKMAEISGIDSMIGAQNGSSSTNEIKKISNTSVVYTFSQTKQLGDLRFYLTPDGKVKEMKNHLAALDKEIPKDPVAQKIITDAQVAIDAAKQAQVH